MDIVTDPIDRERKRGKSIQSSSAVAVLVTLLGFLPPEIIAEILSKLPVKSLLRCRCVCKSWRSYISNPIFVKKHLKVSENNAQLIMKYSSTFHLKSCYISNILNEECTVSHSFTYPTKFSKSKAWIVGSCNGLVCLVIGLRTLYLWNPSTRKSMKLPNSGFKKPAASLFLAYGFGYDEINSDYKLLVINSKARNFNEPFNTQIKIYGLKSGSWRTIKNCPQVYPLTELGTFVSGSLHWAAKMKNEFNSYQSILTFDLSTEIFSEISQPCSGKEDFDSVIGVLNGCLCMLFIHGGKKFDIWILNEYGKTESWTKSFSIPFLNGPMKFEPYTLPLYISKKNEILMVIRYQFVLFQVESKWVKVSYPNVNHLEEVEALTYIESLVSPFPESCHQQEIR